MIISFFHRPFLCPKAGAHEDEEHGILDMEFIKDKCKERSI